MARPRNSGFAGDVTFDGKRYRTSGWKTDNAASAWEHQAMANLLVGKPVPPGPSEAEEVTWGLKAMLDFVFEEHWSKKSGDTSYFEKQIAVLVKDLGPNYPAVDLAGASGYATLKAACEARGNSGDTINKKASIISKALKVSIEKGKLQGIMKPQFERQPKGSARERIITREEEAACLGWARQCHSDFADWFVLGIDTGFRSYSEGLNIYPHVDVRNRDLTIRGRVIGEDASNVVNIATAKRRTKTGDGKTRVVGLTNRAAEIVERHRKTLMHSQKMFHGSLSKQRITDLWNRMKEHLKITDTEFVPYSLRHTFGTRMILAQVRVEDLSVLMGHSTIQQTWKYVHLAGLVQTGAVNKLEEYLKG